METKAPEAPAVPASSLPIPDVLAAAADMSLRFVDLNRRVNSDYGVLGAIFQAILDPDFDRTGTSQTWPSWFAFAAFASRAIGQAQLGAEVAMKAATEYTDSGDAEGALAKHVSPHLGALTRGWFAELESDDHRALATFLVAFHSASRHREAFSGVTLGGLVDPRTLVVGVQRLLDLLKSAPGTTTAERLGSVSVTLRNTMTDGNRRIYRDIGGSAQRYLTYRRARSAPPTPDEVLAEFTLPGSARPEIARAAYDFALAHVTDSPRPIDFDKRFPELGDDSLPLVVAGLALYELAGRTAELARRNPIISFANNDLIYREQHDAVQPAFTPGSTLPGEVDRLSLMQVITPGLEVALRLETWKLWEYADRNPALRTAGLLTSRVSEYNWGVWSERWAPVIDTFGPCYRNPAAMWPPPSPDPDAPM
ncbi:MAG: hypothetical protein R3B70_30665 [Polyangiaceae bacterium]